MRLSLNSSSTRTFLVIPAATALETALSRRRLRVWPLWLLVWGYAQYRLSGRYRSRVGGGGPGMSVPPDRVVTSGIYAYTRNPMYMGHLVFLCGLILATRSPLAVAGAVLQTSRLARHAASDERELLQLFGRDYEVYMQEVPRWVAIGLGRRI